MTKFAHKCFIKYFYDFIHKTRDLHLDDHDLMVSFDVISLFTKIHAPESLNIISRFFDKETLHLIEICLSSTFFSFKSKFYEQTKGTTMGSCLSLIVANIFMEHFETLALNSFSLKPKCWFRFVYETFSIWP